MELLAIDPGSQTGWALSPPYREVVRIRLGSWEIPKGKSVPINEKRGWLRYHLSELLDREPVGYAAVEQPDMGVRSARRRAGGGKGLPLDDAPEPEKGSGGDIRSTIILWSLFSTITTVLELRGIHYRAVPVKTWRKEILGNGNISGEESKRICRERLEARDVRVRNVNQAEAGGLLHYLDRFHRRWQDEDEALRRSAAA